MATQANVFEDGFERVQEQFRSAGEELQKLQDRAAVSRREFADKAQARADKMQKRLLKIPAIKRADAFRVDVTKAIETNVDEFMARIPVASSNEVTKLEKKVNALTRKVRALEKAAAQQ